MNPDIPQRTLKKSISYCGLGLHTGEECRIDLHPAEPEHGIVFASERVHIPASAEYVCDTSRGTTLGCNGVLIHTIEHLMAAIVGMGLDNVLVEVSGVEIPIGDGSALPFVELIDAVGMDVQNKSAKFVHLDSPVWTSRGDQYDFASPGDGLRISALISYPHPMIGEQACHFVVDPVVFRREIAPARTFCTSREIEAVLAAGLGKGGREDNVIIAHDDHYSIPLRFEDEFVRHKVLDVIGDLALVGARVNADIAAIKSSHTLNTQLAERIRHTYKPDSQGG